MADSKWRSLIEWLRQEYKGSAQLISAEGGKEYHRLLGRLDSGYQAGGWLRQQYFTYLRFKWPIVPDGHVYHRFAAKTGTSFVYAYALLSADGSNYICVSPTFDSKDGEYRSRLITLADFLAAYEDNIQPLSKIEEKILNLLSSGKLLLSVEHYPKSSEPSRVIEEQRLPLKCMVVASLLDLGGWLQFHALPSYVQGIGELSAIDPDIALMCSRTSSESPLLSASFQKGLPARDTTVGCGSKLIPLTLREVMSPWDPTYSAWRVMTVRDWASDMVLNVLCPSFAFANQWTYIDGGNEGLFENPNVKSRYRRGETAREATHNLREARRMVKSDIPTVVSAADFDAHIYDAIEYAQGFLLMSNEVLYTTEENVGFTLASLPLAVTQYKYPQPEYARLVSDPAHFAKLAFDYLYGAHCLHAKLGVIHADAHTNNLTVYRFGATHTVKGGLESPKFEPIVEAPLVVYVAGPRGETDTYVFPFTGTAGCVIDFSRSLIGPHGAIYADLVTEQSEIVARNFMRDQVNRILRTLFRSAPSFTKDRQEKLKAAILANPEAVFRVLSYADFMTIGRGLVSMLDTKLEGEAAKRFKPPPELREFAKRIADTARDAMVIYMRDLVEASVDPKSIPFAGESLLPKLFANYLFSAWDTKDLRKGTLVDAYNFNNPLKWSGTDYERFPPWARLDKLEEHMGEVKITDMFPRGVKDFLDSLIPTPRVDRIADRVQAEQDSLDPPAEPTSSWIESRANGHATALPMGGGSDTPAQPKELYHGSRTKIKKWLEPKPSGVLDGESAVFATPHRWMAIAFASGLKHTQIDLGVAAGTPYLMEMYPGAFDLLKIRGFLYTVNGEGFHRDSRLMGPQELISPKRVRIVKTERLKSLYDAIVSDGTARLVPDSERKSFVRDKSIPMHDDQEQ